MLMHEVYYSLPEAQQQFPWDVSVILNLRRPVMRKRDREKEREREREREKGWVNRMNWLGRGRMDEEEG